MKKLLLIFFLVSSVLIASDVWFGDIADDHLWLSDKPRADIPCQFQKGHAIWVRISDWIGDEKQFNDVTVYTPPKPKPEIVAEPEPEKKRVSYTRELPESPGQYKKAEFDTDTKTVSKRVISKPPEAKKDVFVREHVKQSGTRVGAYMRSSPGTKKK